MPLTIAIVGRPNVGKSTLFNRLLRRRLALVDDQPGLTRDRREAEARIGSRDVVLIDTAGFEDAKEGLSARMRAQTEAAIAQADLVLFLIDARTGIVPADEIFVEIVRTSGKPVLLVANKSEGRAAEAGLYEAFSLGLGEPLAVSAEHDLGIGDLTVAIEAAAESRGGPASELDPAETEDAEPHALRIAVVGRPNVGKSTLVNALFGEERMITGPEAGITRDSISVPLEWRGTQIRLFDTAGLRRKMKVEGRPEELAVSDAIRAIRFAEVVVLLLDAERPFEKQDLQIADLVYEEGRAVVVAVNKWDLVNQPQSRLHELREACQRLLPQLKGVALVPVSALSGKGTDALMRAVIAANEVWNRRVPTNPLNRWLKEAVEAHPPPAVSGRRIKIRYITQTKARPPTFVAFCSRPRAIPDSYMRYLLNSLRETFDLPGVPIRLLWRKGANPYVREAEAR
jgi:GTP-binding protein